MKTNNLKNLFFLNDKKFDSKIYIEAIEDNLSTLDSEFEEILQELKCSKFSLNKQEMEYISHYPERFFDYLLFRWKFTTFFDKKRVENMPQYLLIEPTSICNIRCVMCFQTDVTFTKKPFMGNMEFDLFKKIIDQSEEGGVKAITMASRGEPFVNPKMEKFLDYSGNKFLELKVNTNGLLLDEKKIDSILRNNVNYLVYSVDSYEKDSYEKIRFGGKFDTLIKNVELFNEIRERHYPQSKISTRVTAVKLDGYDQNFENFNNFWQNYVDEVSFKKYIQREDTYHNDDSKTLHPCPYLWSRFYVWWDGSCGPCDVDYKGVLKLGNANLKSLKEIWNSNEMVSLRTQHINQDRKKVYPCNICTLV